MEHIPEDGSQNIPAKYVLSSKPRENTVCVTYLYVFVWSSHRPQRMEPTIPATTRVKPILPAFNSWFWGEQKGWDSICSFTVYMPAFMKRYFPSSDYSKCLTTLSHCHIHPFTHTFIDSWQMTCEVPTKDVTLKPVLTCSSGGIQLFLSKVRYVSHSLGWSPEGTLMCSWRIQASKAYISHLTLELHQYRSVSVFMLSDMSREEHFTVTEHNGAKGARGNLL